MNIKQKKPFLTKVFATAIVVALLVGGWFFYAHSKQSAVAPNSPIDSQDTADYSPPTKQEMQSSQDAKKRNNEDTNSSSNTDTSSSKKTISVGLSFAEITDEKLEIRAFTQGVIEGTGTCTAMVTRNALVVKKSSKAFVDATSSICNPIYIPLSNLESGTWNVVVRFTSPDAAGTSEVVKVVVP